MLEVRSLKKSFGPIRAVDGISFSAKKSQVIGLLGPNGAGKSTTMKMLTGFLRPDDGEAFVGGHNILTAPLEAKTLMGYVPENAPLYEEMYVAEFLTYIARLRGLPESKIPGRLEEIKIMCALQGVMGQKIETLSKGYKRRVSLAQALIHDPQILILDEPTDGLDPNQKHDVRQLIKKLAKDKCILISTHILEEVSEVCTDCIIIAEGKKIFEGTPKELAAKSAQGRLQDVFRAMTTKESVEGVVSL